MNYLTNYYKNLSEQLQQRVDILSNRIRLLSEDAGDSEAGDPVENTENPWMTPEWAPPEFNPRLPQSPVRPPNEQEWERDNPYPDAGNYPGRYQDPDYIRDVELWMAARDRAHANYSAWYRYMRGLNRITGQGKDKEWVLPRYRIVPGQGHYGGSREDF